MILVVAVFWLLACAAILAVVTGGADLVPAPFDPVAEAERILKEVGR
jgi:hypothetical protein